MANYTVTIKRSDGSIRVITGSADEILEELRKKEESNA